jgi:hypothetical protein
MKPSESIIARAPLAGIPLEHKRDRRGTKKEKRKERKM